MWRENPTWCQQIIAAQLAKLGYQISPRTVAKYRRSNLDRQRGQRWTTFIRNHLHETWACDFFVLVTGRFRVLYVFVVLSLGRRTIVHAGVTEHPTACWAAQRIAEATSDAQQIPRFLVHDRDSIYGTDFHRRVRGLGTRLLATPPHSPTANPFAERVIEPSAGIVSTTSSSKTRNMPSAFSTTTWPTTMAGPIAASECSRPTAPDTYPLLGRQRELQSLESRSSAVCIIATALGWLQGPHRRRKGVPLERRMEYLLPTASRDAAATVRSDRESSAIRRSKAPMDCSVTATATSSPAAMESSTRVRLAIRRSRPGAPTSAIRAARFRIAGTGLSIPARAAIRPTRMSVILSVRASRSCAGMASFTPARPAILQMVAFARTAGSRPAARASSHLSVQ